ncbi:MAG: hypothetical protein J6W26_04310 [Bacteroidales bacterium]|nr:hypothetical protein [Bacteroidales bacterium]
MRYETVLSDYCDALENARIQLDSGNKAMLAVVEAKYPGLWGTLCQKYPDLDEDEKKSFILAHFKVSRQEEADYLGTTVNMVDKTRGRVKKKMGEG